MTKIFKSHALDSSEAHRPSEKNKQVAMMAKEHGSDRMLPRAYVILGLAIASWALVILIIWAIVSSL